MITDRIGITFINQKHNLKYPQKKASDFKSNCVRTALSKTTTTTFSIYTVSDLGVLSNLIGSLSLANEHYSPPTE